MITLQDLIEFAESNGVKPEECVLLLKEKCSVGGDQLDALIEPKLVHNENIVDENDDIVMIVQGITLEIMPW